jgi:Arabinose-binding domain of AraC transcription regulator, N-term
MVIMDTHSYALDTTWRTVLKDLGVVPANVLRRAALPDDLLQQPSVRLAPEDYYRLWDSVEVETGDPLFPIRLYQAIRSESFSPPLFAALCSPNLLVAAQRIARYKTLVAPMRLNIAEARNVVTVELIWLDAPLSPPVSLVANGAALLRVARAYGHPRIGASDRRHDHDATVALSAIRSIPRGSRTTGREASDRVHDC